MQKSNFALDTSNIDHSHAEKLYRVLSDHLCQSTRGKQLIASFEADPQSGSVALADYLREHLPKDNALAEQLAVALGAEPDAQFTNIVTGQVDQIINIARLGILNLTVKKYLFVFQNVRQVVAFLLVLCLVGAGVAYGIWSSLQPDRMDGDFNIAVAKFGQVSENKLTFSTRATQISDALFNFLDSEYEAVDFNLDVQIAHKNMPLIVEHKEAALLAQRINADVIIYGSVYIEGNTAEFSPRFYVAKQAEVNALTGQSELAYPIQFDVSELRFQDKVNIDLRTRATVLLLFTEGLVYLSARDLDAAKFAFESAVCATQDLEPFKGKESLYLFAAYVNERQGHFEQATKHIAQALTLNSEYARAYLLWGNVHYAQAIKTWDSVQMNEALTNYKQAIQAQDQPPSAYIIEQASVALGNIYVIQAQQTNDADLFANAIEHYQRVAMRYEETQNDHIKSLAAIAYFGLGAAYERQEKFAQAVQAYRDCSENAEDETLRQRAEQQLSYVNSLIETQ